MVIDSTTRCVFQGLALGLQTQPRQAAQAYFCSNQKPPWLALAQVNLYLHFIGCFQDHAAFLHRSV